MKKNISIVDGAVLVIVKMEKSKQIIHVYCKIVKFYNATIKVIVTVEARRSSADLYNAYSKPSRSYITQEMH